MPINFHHQCRKFLSRSYKLHCHVVMSASLIICYRTHNLSMLTNENIINNIEKILLLEVNGEAGHFYFKTHW